MALMPSWISFFLGVSVGIFFSVAVEIMLDWRAVKRWKRSKR